MVRIDQNQIRLTNLGRRSLIPSRISQDREVQRLWLKSFQTRCMHLLLQWRHIPNLNQTQNRNQSRFQTQDLGPRATKLKVTRLKEMIGCTPTGRCLQSTANQSKKEIRVKIRKFWKRRMISGRKNTNWITRWRGWKTTQLLGNIPWTSLTNTRKWKTSKTFSENSMISSR